jgi:HNH endonuclease
MMKTLINKFNTNVQVTPGCWFWLGGKQGNDPQHSYGRIQIGNHKWYAHRVSYEIYNGPISNGDVIRHRCDNPNCVNPAHLLSGTQADNLADCKNRGRNATGENNGRSKLTDKEVLEILDLAGCRLFTQREISNWYGCAQATISHIKSGFSRTYQTGLPQIERY